MNGKRRPWLLSLALILSLASRVDAQTLSRDEHPRSGRASPPPRGGSCGPTEITESVTQNIVSGNSIACQDPMTGFTLDNHYWRAFELSDFGIVGGFEVCQVEIAVEAAISVEGTQPLTVNLYSTASGAFPGGTLTPIGTTSFLVPDQDQTFLTVPITGTAPAGSALVVEVFSPDGSIDLYAFFIGSNPDGQTAPSYFSSVNCSIPTPTDLASLDFPNMHIVMNVRGTESFIGPTALEVDPAGNGVLEIGETAVVAPSWTNTGAMAVGLTGTASNLIGPAGHTISDSTADYGTILSSTTSNCFDATGDCYAVAAAGARPVHHLDLSFDETVTPTSTLKTWTLHVGESFTDVSTDIVLDPYYPFIETIFHFNVTAGCLLGDTFCPTANNLRSEMAVFLLKASQPPGYVPPSCTGIFSDVPCPATPTFPYSDFIEDLSVRGVTAGCSMDPGPPPTIQYCPDRDILRSEMAVFLLKMSQGSGYIPPACTPPGIFSDVPCPSLYADWIEDIFLRGITAGCSSDPGPPPTIQFCPDNKVTRQEMAVFLTKTFGLVLYGP